MSTRITTAGLAWTALAVNVVTILGGTLVRATGSGAGCGVSWPSCQGVLVPGLGEMATQIEFGHRVTSGLALLSVVALFVSVYRNYGKGAAARKAVKWAAALIFVESLLGAWLVLASLVEDNATVMRAVSVPIHLVNTLGLLGALTATAWIVSRDGERIRWHRDDRNKMIAAILALVVLAATGAIAALADTLFPVDSVREGLAADFDTTAHFLTRLRTIHPVVAVLTGGLLIHLGGSSLQHAQRPAMALILLVGLQLGVGILNVLLLTPIAMQVVHLLLANLIWITLLILGAELGTR